eukprot:1188262-Prorocentrum_minimum.AAC.3
MNKLNKVCQPYPFYFFLCGNFFICGVPRLVDLTDQALEALSKATTTAGEGRGGGAAAVSKRAGKEGATLPAGGRRRTTRRSIVADGDDTDGDDAF